MPVKLRPTIGRGGLVKLDRLAVFLYAFWFWQFAIAVFFGYIGLWWWAFGMTSGLFFVLSNFLLTTTLFVEANFFAKGTLTPNRFLCFEVLKISYITAQFVLYALTLRGKTAIYYILIAAIFV